MEQRDLLKDQIEQLGKVLAKLLAGFLGLKEEGKASQGIAVINEQMKGKLDLDILLIARLGKAELKTYLQDRQLRGEHIETLSDYFKEMGLSAVNTAPSESKIWLQKAIDLLDVADEVSGTLSFERIQRKAKMKQLRTS